MARSNPLTQRVGLDSKEQPFVISIHVQGSWYLVHPWGRPEEGTLMTIQQIAQQFHGFQSEISYRAARNR